MLQDKCDVRRAVEIRYQLYVILEGVVGEVLKLGRGKGVGLHDGGRALELKVPFQLQGEAVDLEEGRLANRLFQGFGALEMMGVVPIDLAMLEVGPVLDPAFGKPESAIARAQQLHQRLGAVKQSCRSIGLHGDTVA